MWHANLSLIFLKNQEGYLRLYTSLVKQNAPGEKGPNFSIKNFGLNPDHEMQILYTTRIPFIHEILRVNNCGLCMPVYANSKQCRPRSDCLTWVCTACLGLFGRQLVFNFRTHLIGTHLKSGMPLGVLIPAPATMTTFLTASF